MSDDTRKLLSIHQDALLVASGGLCRSIPLGMSPQWLVRQLWR